MIRVARKMEIKYAADAAHEEKLLREKIRSLYSWLEKYPVVRRSGFSGMSKPKTDRERMAIKGQDFCRDVVTMVDYLQSKDQEINLGEVREVLLNLISLMKEHIGSEDEKVQFPEVAETVYYINMLSGNKKREHIKEESAQARRGLARIFNISIGMLEDLRKLEIMVPEKFTHSISTEVDINAPLPERITPQRRMLSVYDIVDFIRMYGDDYGLSSRDDWGKVFTDNPELMERMTTVINTINRTPKHPKTGKPMFSPKDAGIVKAEIEEILRISREKKENNVGVFEMPEEQFQQMNEPEPIVTYKK